MTKIPFDWLIGEDITAHQFDYVDMDASILRRDNQLIVMHACGGIHESEIKR